MILYQRKCGHVWTVKDAAACKRFCDSMNKITRCLCTRCVRLHCIIASGSKVWIPSSLKNHWRGRAQDSPEKIEGEGSKHFRFNFFFMSNVWICSNKALNSASLTSIIFIFNSFWYPRTNLNLLLLKKVFLAEKACNNF